jgi:multiple sugar transport system permease protein
MGFFKSIPLDIEEQALVDGYSRVGAMVRIVLPISISGLLTVVVFSFTLSMHEFIYALGPLMAGALIPSIPAAILYTLFLDRFIAGFTMGAIK